MQINKIHFLFSLIVIAFGLSIYLSVFTPLVKMMPTYYDLAADIKNNNYTNTFLPFGYSALISGYIMNNVGITAKVVHFLSLVLIWIIVLYLYLSINLINKIKNLKFYDINFVCIFFWFTFFFFHPYFHLNIVRVTDTSVTTFFITAIFTLTILKFKSSKILLMTGGVLLGILIAIRPNSIILILFFLIFFNKNFVSKYQTIILFIPSLLAYMFFSKFITGNFLFWPDNGPYNLFSGNNPYAYEFFKLQYNGEHSLSRANEWCGIKIKNVHLVSSIEYINCTLNYIQNDFFGFVKTTIFKVYNLLFRPNLRLAFETYKFVFQILIVIPAYIWWLLFFLSSNFRKEFSVKWGALFIIFYSSVFIATNSDPRFALPLDIIYIISAINFMARKMENI